jgi:hypothetical protein
MSPRLSSALAGLCGILGAAAFGVYGSSVLVPFPAPNATVAQVTAFVSQYHDAMLFTTWLQAIGRAFQLSGTGYAIARKRRSCLQA